MDAKKELSKIKQEIHEKEVEERINRHRLKREQAKADLQKRRRGPEYRVRTHRLCNKGGTIECFYPETKELTAEEFYELVDMLDHDVIIRNSWKTNAKEIIDRRGKEADA